MQGTLILEDALARTIEAAGAAGKWDVVAQLATELQARRLASAGVLTLDAVRDRKTRSPE